MLGFEPKQYKKCQVFVDFEANDYVKFRSVFSLGSSEFLYLFLYINKEHWRGAFASYVFREEADRRSGIDQPLR